MKAFVFQCNKCGRVLEKDHSPIGWEIECKKTYSIECCGENMERVIESFKKINVGNKEYFHTQYSDALAVAPSQIEEHKREHPDVKIDAEGRPGFDNVQQHHKYLEAIGAYKQPQRIRRNKRKIR
jgi:hypothetical protein